MWFDGRALASMYKESPKFDFSTMLETNRTNKRIGKTGIVIYSCNLSVLGLLQGGYYKFEAGLYYILSTRLAKATE